MWIFFFITPTYHLISVATVIGLITSMLLLLKIIAPRIFARFFANINIQFQEVKFEVSIEIFKYCHLLT